MNQNYINRDDTSSTPQIGLTPSISEIFSTPPARQISEKSYPLAKVGGGTNYAPYFITYARIIH